MDLKILEIASDTENHKVIKNHTHQSKNKNPLCGDEMEISLIVKNNIIQDIGYQCKSCVYCQASVSLLSRWVLQAPIKEISDFAEEVLKDLGNENYETNEDLSNQKKFWEIYYNYVPKSKMGQVQPKISPCFLRNNTDLLN